MASVNARTDEQPQHCCPICFAEFTKSDHLNRHYLSREFITTSLKGMYTKATRIQKQMKGLINANTACVVSTVVIRDALLRHLRTCDRRLRAGLPPPILDHKKRGRRQNACERCAKLKRKCSGSQPCKACADQNQDCNYGQTPPKKNCFTSPPELRKDPILY
ncbi:F-actin-capping protein subunit alpha [Fusarium oxysporum f. sp. albedinis]|nr:F-actin-capping protein subunit alpha [Fusarium oxysporum f. sp. albedinis]